MKNSSRVFLSEPPENLSHLDALLIDRVDELAVARDQMASILSEPICRPLAFAGLARVGKSHLLRKLAAEITQEFDVVVDLRISTGLSDGRAVHREMLMQTHSAISNAAGERGVAGAQGGGPLEPLDLIMAAYQEAIEGTATELDVSQLEEVASTLKSARTITPGLPAVLNLLGAAPWG